MSQTPYFSVIVPIYNFEIYAKNCIDSILNQIFKSFEVIRIADNFPNEFFDNVHGEYLLFVDGDTVLCYTVDTNPVSSVAGMRLQKGDL